MRIILLEDDELIAQEIKLYFEIKNHSVICYSNGEELLEDDTLYGADIFLLDINMPKKNGIETLKEIRSLNIETPAVFLTSMSDIGSIKSGFDAGCSDYIKKPFHFEELEIRINKLVFECTSKQPIPLGPNLFYNPTTMELSEKGSIILLTEHEQSLIHYLVKNINHLVDTYVLMDYIWNDRTVNANTLRTKIKKIRSKVEYNFIQNARGLGYRIEKYNDKSQSNQETK